MLHGKGIMAEEPRTHALDDARANAKQGKPGRGSTGCVRLLALGFMAFILTAGLVAWKFMDTLRSGWAWVSANLVTQNIEERFRQSVTRIASTNGDVLEVATLESDESVVRYDMKSIFNDSLPLGTTISEIRVPVVYRYHILLSEEWSLKMEEGGHVVVHAPMLRPSQPPAIRTEDMQKKSDAGWLRFNATESLALLEKNLTKTLENRAGNRSHIHLVREPSRKSVAEFVKKWVLSQQGFHAGEVKSITVLFPDEWPAQSRGQPRTIPPTVQVP